MRLVLWPFLGSRGIFRMFPPGQQSAGLVLLSRASFSPQSAFAYMIFVKPAKGFVPLCTRAQNTSFVVASNVLLWQGQPAAPRAALGRALPAVEGGDPSLLLSTGDRKRVLCLVLGCQI